MHGSTQSQYRKRHLRGEIRNSRLSDSAGFASWTYQFQSRRKPAYQIISMRTRFSRTRWSKNCRNMSRQDIFMFLQKVNSIKHGARLSGYRKELRKRNQRIVAEYRRGAMRWKNWRKATAFRYLRSEKSYIRNKKRRVSAEKETALFY